MVIDLPLHKPALAGVADSRSTCPSYRHVARLGQFEQALEFWLPPHIEAAADERHLRSRTGRSRRQMRRPARRSSNTGGVGRAGAERLGVDAIPCDVQSHKPGGQIAHESGWTTDVEIAVARQIECLDRSCIQPPSNVEIDMGPIF